MFQLIRPSSLLLVLVPNQLPCTPDAVRQPSPLRGTDPSLPQTLLGRDPQVPISIGSKNMQACAHVHMHGSEAPVGSLWATYSCGCQEQKLHLGRRGMGRPVNFNARGAPLS